VLNSLSSAGGQRTSEHAIREFVAWYCSEPRLAFNRTVVLRYRIHGEQDHIQFLLGHVSIQTTERYLGCGQKLRTEVNDLAEDSRPNWRGARCGESTDGAETYA
jgi:integrase